MQTLEEVWGRIEVWFERYASQPRFDPWLNRSVPDILSNLQPGATEEQLQHAEAALRFKLPKDLKALYRLHNGSNYQPIMDRWHLLSVEQMVGRWQMLQEIQHDTFDAEDEDGTIDEDRTPSGPVRKVWWHRRWIPFMDDSAGNSLCLDLVPGPGGQVGQVIFKDREGPAWGPFAPSLYWYLAFFATELEDGEYHLDQLGWPVNEDRLWMVPMTWAPPPPVVAPISQSDLIERVASRTGQRIEETALGVEAMLAVLREGLAAGEEVRLVDFGSFTYSGIAGYRVIDPQAGIIVPVPAPRKIGFDCGFELNPPVS